MDCFERQGLKTQLQDYYSALHAQFDIYDNLYNTNYKLELPDTVQAVKVPIGRLAIENCTDQISTASLRVTVPPRSPKRQDEADKLEKFYYGAWYLNTRYKNHLRDAAKHGILYGKFCFKALWDFAALEKDSDNERPPILPLTLRTIHPRNILEDPSSSPPKYVIEVRRMKLGHVMQMQLVKNNKWFPPLKDDYGNDMTDMSDVEFVEYWDDTHWAIDCAGLEVKPLTEHHLGQIPYTIHETGFGMEPEEGAPEERIRGLLHDLGDIIKSISRNWSLLEALMLWAAAPLVIIRTENPEEFKRHFSMKPGQENYLDETDQVEIVKIPDATDELLKQRSAQMQEFDRATAPAVIRGERPTGISAGYPIAILAGQARIKFGATQESLNNACTRVNEIWANIVENVLEEPVTVWAKTPTGMIDEVIKPSDIDGYYINFVDLQPVDPQEEERKLRAGLELAQFLPLRYIMEKYWGIPNAQDVIDERYVEQALASDLIQQYLQERALEKWGLADLARKARTQAQTLMNQPPPGSEMTQFPHQTGGRGGESYEPDRRAEPVLPQSPQEFDLTRRQMRRWRPPRPGEPLPKTWKQGLR